jgi:hypothetical protein
MFRAPVFPQNKAVEPNGGDSVSFNFFDQGDDTFDTSSWTPAPIGAPFGAQISPTLSLGGTLSLSSASQAHASSAISAAASPATVTSETVTSPGSGIVFNNTYDSDVTLAYQRCIEAAEETIESLWTNSITINEEFTTYDSSTSPDALTK